MTIKNIKLGQQFSIGPYRYLKTGTDKVFDVSGGRSVSVNPTAALPILCLHNPEQNSALVYQGGL